MIREKTLKVCVYTPTSAGGHALYTRELLTALAEVGSRRGVAAELVTCSDLAAEHQSNAYPIHPILPPLVPRSTFPTPIHWIGSRLTYYARRERTFLEWVANRGDFDLLHFQEYTPWLAAHDLNRLRRRGYSLFFTVHNVIFHHYRNRLHRLLRDSCLRAAWRTSDALLVHTEGLRDALADFLGPGHPPIFVTPHGIWSEHGAGAGREEAGARPENGVAPGGGVPRDRHRHRHRLLFFGVIRPNKGLDVLLRALALPPLGGCDLTVAGEVEEPGYRARIDELIRRLPAGQVTLVDQYIDECAVAGYFERSELLILPYTFFAAQSGVLYLALAYGRPLVVTDAGGLGECVRQWGVGVVVPPNDPEALAQGIVQALEPAAYRAAVAAIGRVRQELSWSKMAEATIDAYQSVVA
jgi:glycosyltransferase involved in cell wall biosynthesis